MHYCTFKRDKGKKLGVQSQIYNFFPQKLLSANSFQNLNFPISLFIAKKKSDLLVLTGDLDYKLHH